MATIYDVARAAGVSPKTVSRVLNGDAPVGKGTRDAVESAMSELGYVPSNAARMMRSSRSGLIGLITGAISLNPEPTDPHGLPDLFIVQGIQQTIGTSPHDADDRRHRRPAGPGAAPGAHLPSAPGRGADLRGRVPCSRWTCHRSPAATPLVLANCFDDHGTPAVVPDDAARAVRPGHPADRGRTPADRLSDPARYRWPPRGFARTATARRWQRPASTSIPPSSFPATWTNRTGTSRAPVGCHRAAPDPARAADRPVLRQ